LKKIRVGIVNYLNTRPLLYGLRQPPFFDHISLSLDYPAAIAASLKGGKVDLGLVPVAMLKEVPDLQRVGSHCIATDGEIASVCLFSSVPLDQIQTVLLDYQSRTSVALLRILMKHHWKLPVKFTETTGDGYRSQISGTTAGLIIGDRALAFRGSAAYCYDLGLAWREFTGLPFVFAAWLSAQPLPEDFLAIFNEANQQGLDRLPEVLAGIETPIQYDLMHYFTQNVVYHWRSEMQESLRLFLALAQ
jgi:chorismate dehydratase